MKIHRLEENQFMEAIQLSEYAFQYTVNKEQIAGQIETMKKHHLVYGINENDRLAAKFHFLPLEVYSGDRKLKMGGLAGVATYPEYRRQGYVNELLRFILVKMYSEGYALSMLHPFSVPFYRKYGWELFSNRLTITLSKGDLVRKKQAAGKIKRYTKDSHPQEIEHIYNQYAKQHPGMLVRSTSWWLQSVYDTKHAAVFYDTRNNPLGYLLYRIGEHKMTVSEFVPLTPEARIGLWNYICQHDSMVDSVSITAHEREPLFHILPEPRVPAKLTPYFMARIIHAEAFLKQYPFNWSSGPKEIALHLKDTILDGNQKSFVIKKDNIETQSGDMEGISLSINELTAILLGYKTPVELFDAGLVSGSQQTVQDFQDLLPDYTPFFYDFF
ncbi:Predicted acetyltransferase [Bacillus sp. OV322]|uniref:GNAT family N-acetyltransferase n=1 Tax=Bacillus sp. OV322 TaxID=1882764 RepID=UPI0008E3BCFB|nr:GNAT family N-acetyltransferase [Bacillus sp. OV322]SFC46166.1 Predicted acetyltransferase [Bacillus sp. OV322]